MYVTVMENHMDTAALESEKSGPYRSIPGT